MSERPICARPSQPGGAAPKAGAPAAWVTASARPKASAPAGVTPVVVSRGSSSQPGPLVTGTTCAPPSAIASASQVRPCASRAVETGPSSCLRKTLMAPACQARRLRGRVPGGGIPVGESVGGRLWPGLGCSPSTSPGARTWPAASAGGPLRSTEQAATGPTARTGYPVPMTAPAPLWSFLGPAGTFTEMALRQVAPADVELDPCPDVPTALDHLRERTVEAAVVPIENSVEGGVNATLDNLVASTPLVIAAEMAVPITFVLAGRPGTRLEDVRAISTHPHAWAQCRGWVHRNLPEAVYVAGTSTSAPARALATTEGDTGFQAVLCNPLAAEQYGLEVIAGGVADNPDAVTRFVKVTRPGRVGEPTGADKTTLLVHLPHDRSGALLDMLEQFSARGVNLSRIESRPVGDSLGRYRFSIDVEGHVREERVQAALIGLHRTCPVVRFLGSYPRLDARPTAVLAGTSDKDFVVARSWVADVLDGRAL